MSLGPRRPHGYAAATVGTLPPVVSPQSSPRHSQDPMSLTLTPRSIGTSSSAVLGPTPVPGSSKSPVLAQARSGASPLGGGPAHAAPLPVPRPPPPPPLPSASHAMAPQARASVSAVSVQGCLPDGAVSSPRLRKGHLGSAPARLDSALVASPRSALKSAGQSRGTTPLHSPHGPGQGAASPALSQAALSPTLSPRTAALTALDMPSSALELSRPLRTRRTSFHLPEQAPPAPPADAGQPDSDGDGDDASPSPFDAPHRSERLWSAEGSQRPEQPARTGTALSLRSEVSTGSGWSAPGGEVVSAAGRPSSRPGSRRRRERFVLVSENVVGLAATLEGKLTQSQEELRVYDEELQRMALECEQHKLAREASEDRERVIAAIAEELRRHTRQLTAERDVARGEAQTAQAAQDQLRLQLQKVESTVVEMNKREQALASREKSLRQRVAELEASLAEAHKLQDLYTAEREAHEQTRQEGATWRTRAESLAAELSARTADVERLQRELETCTQHEQQLQSQLAVLDELQARNRSLQAQLEARTAELERRETDVLTLQTKVDSLQLNEQLAFWRRQAEESAARADAAERRRLAAEAQAGTQVAADRERMAAQVSALEEANRRLQEQLLEKSSEVMRLMGIVSELKVELRTREYRIAHLEKRVAATDFTLKS